MSLDLEYFNLGYLDTLSYKDTFVHRLDPRIKVLVSFAFVLFVVSCPKYGLSLLIPFFLYPVFLLAVGDIPLKAIAKKVFLVSPFAIFIGIFNPLQDTKVLTTLLGIPISGGWISFLSIMGKFVLTVSTALLLIAVTSFPGICQALAGLGMPRLFVVQLLLLYRYLFVLADEALRMARAREARSFDGRGKEIRTFIKIVSILLIRSVERAERIFRAMLSRGFRGEIRTLKRQSLRYSDILFLVAFMAIFCLFRTMPIVHLLGDTFGRSVK